MSEKLLTETESQNVLSRDSRQNVRSRDPQEIEIRTQGVNLLINNIIGRNQEFFAEPQNRLDFIKSQSAEDFLRFAQYINAKLRGEKPHQLRHDEDEKGGFLMKLHTPSHKDKPAAFKNGYEELQDYLKTSSDSTEKKVAGAAMAVEALVIWVHPFNDGNGRTSRFMAKLIEDGATDLTELAQETAFKGLRRRYYKHDNCATQEGALGVADNEDIMLEDHERDELRERAKNLPSDVVSIGLSIKNLLESDEVRQSTLPKQIVAFQYSR